MDMIPVFKPLLDDSVMQAACASLDRGWLGMGRDAAEFESRVRDRLESPDRHVVAVSTGHAALHLALLRCGVGPGDEVITPAFNNIADLQAILATGARPVFCDVDDETMCMDVAQAADLITSRTRVLLPVDYAAALSQHGDVLALAREHGLRVLRDAAHSFGSRDADGRLVGATGDLCMFSFDPVKNITCIDGGAIVTPNEDDVAALHAMRLIGMGQPADTMYRNERAWTYDVERIGWRYHLANLHGAIGVAQLDRFDEISASRRRIFRTYREKLAGLDWLRLPPDIDENRVPFIIVVRIDAPQRDAFRRHLTSLGVDTGIHWQPGHWFRLFRTCRRGALSVTERAGREIVTLPLHPMMAPEAMERVVDAVRRFEPKRIAATGFDEHGVAAPEPSASRPADRLAAMKRLRAGVPPPRLPIQGPHGIAAYLRSTPSSDPVQSERDAVLLTEWRRREMRWFSSRFTPTVERTRSWLHDVVLPNADRILFMIEAGDGEPIGHIGLANINFMSAEAELDNMIRGVAGAIPGVMALAERALVLWAFDELSLDRITGRVLSNNARTLAHHGRIGFRIIGHTALEHIVDADGDHYVERPGRDLSDDEAALAHIELHRGDRIAGPHELTIDRTHRPDAQPPKRDPIAQEAAQ